MTPVVAPTACDRCDAPTITLDGSTARITGVLLPDGTWTCHTCHTPPLPEEEP